MSGLQLHPPPPGIDAISSVPLYLQSRYSGIILSEATGFVLKHGAKAFLVTNWHVVSGRNFESKEVLSKTAGVPNELMVSFPCEDRAKPPIEVKIELFGPSGAANWYVHPSELCNVDVVAIPISTPPNAQFVAVNDIKTLPIRQRIGMPVFIIGFPFGRRGYGFPVWKQGSIATEPSLSPKYENYLLVDSASRPGMSGSIVLQRVHGLVDTEKVSGQVVSGGDGAARLVGVYSGRLHTKDTQDAQLGIVWPMDWLNEIIEGCCLDSSISAP